MKCFYFYSLDLVIHTEGEFMHEIYKMKIFYLKFSICSDVQMKKKL